MKHILYILFFGCVISSCQIKTERAESPASSAELPADTKAKDKLQAADPRKNERYSLAEDRAKFDELRKDVPAVTRARNDERALYMEWMAEYQRDPSDIRSKFSVLVMKKRDNFNNDMSKIRDEYNKEETKKKDNFSKALTEERNEIKDKSVSREKRSDMYSEIENKRREFYSQLRDDRESFEADYRQKRKDFEDYVKEKTDIFNAELKEYTVKYNEIKKAQGK